MKFSTLIAATYCIFMGVSNAAKASLVTKGESVSGGELIEEIDITIDIHRKKPELSAGELASKAAQGVEAAKETVSEKLSAAGSKASHLAGEFKDRLLETMDTAKETIHKSAEGLRQKSGEGVGAVKETAEEIRRRTEESASAAKHTAQWKAEQLAEGAKGVKETVAHKTAEGVDTAFQTAEEVKRTAAQKLATAKDNVQSAAEKCKCALGTVAKKCAECAEEMVEGAEHKAVSVGDKMWRDTVFAKDVVVNSLLCLLDTVASVPKNLYNAAKTFNDKEVKKMEIKQKVDEL